MDCNCQKERNVVTLLGIKVNYEEDLFEHIEIKTSKDCTCIQNDKKDNFCRNCGNRNGQVDISYKEKARYINYPTAKELIEEQGFELICFTGSRYNSHIAIGDKIFPIYSHYLRGYYDERYVYIAADNFSCEEDSRGEAEKLFGEASFEKIISYYNILKESLTKIGIWDEENFGLYSMEDVY